MAYLLVFAGLVFLIGGADLLVRGASRLAYAFGLSPLIVGLTVVAFGTGSPEVAVGIGAAVSGKGEIAIGNVVGSNVANILLILGVAALILPISVQSRLVRVEVPLMVAVSGLLLLFALNGRLTRAEGVVLLLGLATYVSFVVLAVRRSGPSIEEPVRPDALPEPAGGGPYRPIAFLVVGLASLVVGATALVEGATEIAADLGLSDLIIGLTVVAIGTSLPELATTALAAVKGERSLAIGNAIGSNIFNVLGVLGLSIVVSPDAIEVPAAALRFDLPIMLVVAGACLPFFFTDQALTRREGALFIAYYAAYLLYLLLASTDHDALSPYSTAMILFVAPLTVIAVLIVVYREVRSRRLGVGSAEGDS